MKSHLFTDIKADYPEISSAAQRFTGEAERIKQIAHQLGGGTEALRHGWTGQGAQRFQQEMAASILPEFRRLAGALAQSGAALKNIEQIFQTAEEEAARLLQMQAQGIEPGARSFEAFQLRGEGGQKHGADGWIDAPAGQGHGRGVETGAPGSVNQAGGGGDGKIIDQADLTELAVFFSEYTQDLVYKGYKAIVDKYLNDPRLVAVQKDIIRDLVARAQSDKPPLTAKEFYALVNQHVNDPGTALLVAHNILKEFTRPTGKAIWASGTEIKEFSPTEVSRIAWSRDENAPPGKVIYEMAGERFEIDTTSLHPNALAEYNGHPSAFYMMFSKDQFGTADAGDWYHYFATGTMAYYGATDRLTEGSLGTDPRDQTGLGMIVRSISSQQSDGNILASGYKGWRYANALSFMEGGYYGTDYSANQAEADASVLRESQIHRQGALLGLEAAGVPVGDNWSWYVPTAGSLRHAEPLDNYLDVIQGLDDDTQGGLDVQGNKK